MPAYSLVYFDIRGRAEPIRLLLAGLGVPFTDAPFPREQWPAVKARMPLGQVPVLVTRADDGSEHPIPQSMAILRHLARAHGGYGTTEAEALAADIVVETVIDTRAILAPLLAPMVRGKDPVALKNAVEERLPPMLARLERLHAAGPGGLFVGAALTWADCVAYDFLDALRGIHPASFADLPRLTSFLAAFEAVPALGGYLASRRPSELAPLRRVLETGEALG